MPIDNFAGDYQSTADEELSRLKVSLPPPLASDTDKPPWRPKTAGIIAFFFGPLAGAMVVAISLRRMSYQQHAKRVMWLALGMAVGEAIILFFSSDVLSQVVGLAAEIAFLLIFPALMDKDFKEWQGTHSTQPSSGWNAIGWGLVGTVLLLTIFFLVFLALSTTLPSKHLG